MGDWLLLVGAAIGLGSMALMLRRKNRFGKKSVASIASAVEGQVVRVRGEVAAAEPLEAPYTDRPCVYWELEFRNSAVGNFTTLEASDRCDFELSDGTGLARVHAGDCSFHVVRDPTEIEHMRDMSERAKKLVDRFDHRLAAVGQIEIYEGIIGIGDTVDVVGSGVREPLRAPTHERERGYRDAPETALVFSGGTEVFAEERESVYIG